MASPTSRGPKSPRLPLPLPLPLPKTALSLLMLATACASAPATPPPAAPPHADALQIDGGLPHGEVADADVPSPSDGDVADGDVTDADVTDADGADADGADAALDPTRQACIAEGTLMACSRGGGAAACEGLRIRRTREGADRQEAEEEALAACRQVVRRMRQGEGGPVRVESSCEIRSCGLAAHDGHPPRARVRLGVPRRIGGDSSFSRGVLRAAMAARIGSLTRCYRLRLEEHPSESARTTATLTFDGAGRVVDVAFEQPPDQVLLRCIRRSLRSVRLPAGSADGATFAVEISLVPAGPPPTVDTLRL